ncbi:MAG: hypothetical protein EXQ93_00570 [Alphaproteobacteria bacterium]|nr:hypothetical protein [Alphaproteobacteria bacterium]
MGGGDSFLASETTIPMVVYVLYLIGLATGVAAVIGVVLAYVNRDKAAGTWLTSHYRYQTRTFWIGLLICVVGGITVLVGIGFLILLGFAVWVAVRSILGINRLASRQPIANPAAWLW